MKIRIVIDTNTIISGLLWKGLPNELLKLARDGHIEVCSTNTIFEEVMRVLKYPRIQKRLEMLGVSEEEVIDYYENIVNFYTEKSTVDIVRLDDSDNRFIEAAIDSSCPIIVSGDKHLLSIKKYEEIMILNAKDFLEVYKNLKK